MSREIETNGAGHRVVPDDDPRQGATPGGGLATVLVTTRDDGDATDRQVLTVTE